jgi:hypothetical protein
MSCFALATFLSASLGELSWPQRPLDAEHGPQGVMVVSSAGTDVQWDISPVCAHNGAQGYRVIVAKPFARGQDAMLVLPPFRAASAMPAIKLTFWARVLLPPQATKRATSKPTGAQQPPQSSAASARDPRAKVVFVATNAAPWAAAAVGAADGARRGGGSPAPKRREMPMDAWMVKLEVNQWKVREDASARTRRASLMRWWHGCGLSSHVRVRAPSL